LFLFLFESYYQKGNRVNINYKQPQFELFPGQSTVGDDATKPRLFLANLTLTIENLVVLSILCIMLAVFAYSLGVERGKYVMAAQFKEKAQVKPLMAEAPLSNSGQIAETKVGASPAVAAVAPQNVPGSSCGYKRSGSKCSFASGQTGGCRSCG
jgi:hypothetical protein